MVKRKASTKMMNVRLEQSILDKIDNLIPKNAKSRTEWVKKACLEKLNRDEIQNEQEHEILKILANKYLELYENTIKEIEKIQKN